MSPTKKITCLAILLSFLNTLSFAQLKLPAVITDSMVLQQKTSDAIWGWASAGEKISVQGSWMKAAVTAVTDASGKWMTHIEAPAAGGPFTLTIKGKETIVLKDILIGEVWVCSGQSNMEMPVKGWDGAPVKNSAEEISKANYPNIRLFTVKRNYTVVPQDDVTGSWSACTPTSVADFSATAYFFGMNLFKELHVPIGLIHTSWGGTPAEAWTSDSALRTLHDFDEQLNNFANLKDHLQEAKAEDSKNDSLWQQQQKNISMLYAADYNDQSWKTMHEPGKWEGSGYADLDGIVWYRKTIDIPQSWVGKDLTIQLGPIDDEDITFFNGEKVGGTASWIAGRSYTIPAKLVKAGKNVIAVRVTDTGGDGGFTGGNNDLKIFPSGGSDTVALNGDWLFNIEYKKQLPKGGFTPNTPTTLYNGMIAPLIPYGIRGAIWYQGESNVGRSAQYEKLFPTMISDWRKRWNEGNFPFYFVQIAPYRYGNDTTSAALRDAQRKTLSLTNTGMAITLDVGQTNNIHPADKPTVGYRLALLALNKTYNKKMVPSGPLYKSLKTEGNKIIVAFTDADGLTAKGDLNGFEIAGADGKFFQAKAVIQGNTVVAQSDDVSSPVAVRYAWKDTPEATLYNGAGLPASSFSSK